jgi:HEAT repeat protein
VQRAEAAAAFDALDLRAFPFLIRVVLEGGEGPFFRQPLRQLGGVVGLASRAVPRPEERVDDALSLLRRRQVPPAGLLGPEVLTALESPDPDRRSRALTLLACAEEAAPVIPQIIRGLRDPEKRVRLAAAETADRLGSEALPALIENLEADWCPTPAIRAVGQLGAQAAQAVPLLERRARALLENYARDPDPDLQACAVAELRSTRCRPVTVPAP